MCGNNFSKCADEQFAQFLHDQRWNPLPHIEKIFNPRTQKELQVMKDSNGNPIEINTKNLDSYTPGYVSMIPKEQTLEDNSFNFFGLFSQDPEPEKSDPKKKKKESKGRTSS